MVLHGSEGRSGRECPVLHIAACTNRPKDASRTALLFLRGFLSPLFLLCSCFCGSHCVCVTCTSQIVCVCVCV